MRKLSVWFLSLMLIAAAVFGCMTAMAAETATVAENTTTGATYEDLAKALNDAKAGETVILQQDVGTVLFSVPNDVTVDLNGHQLTATYASVFGTLVDNSAENAGVLKVDANKFLLKTTNKQLPVKVEGGYKFVAVRGFNTRVLNSGAKYVFQPLFEDAAHGLLAQGAAATGVSIQVEVTWAGENGTDSRTFVYNDSFVDGFIGSYNATTGGYGKMFSLTVSNPGDFKDLTFTCKVVSETGVTFAPAKAPAVVTEDVTLENDQASALVAAGTKLTDGDVTLDLTTNDMAETTSNVTLAEGESIRSIDVHVVGVSKENTVPVIVTLNEVTMAGLNEGNIALYHVENGKTVEMTRVYTVEEVDAHNEYYYDIPTGTITMALQSFSEVAVVADEVNAWGGKFAGFTGSGTAAAPYIIANADQLAKMSKLVSENEEYASAHYKLVADVNFGGAENAEGNGNVFYPIGYWKEQGTNNQGETYYGFGNAFSGVFDGNGNTVSGVYQNTWLMDGDYGAGYYKAAMGLFGAVYDANIKNLTIKNFQSDGEFTPTGCVAAYAGGKSVFENIYLTNCNPRVYNTGNGGIVGLNYNSTTAGNKDELTFRNITVDQTNKITALWGSWDVACGGILGRVREDTANPTELNTVTFENCHVSAIIDVYNDVCANYQYYQYRYCGMLIGTVDYITDVEGVDVEDVVFASGCTVTYGDWNEYWYCELVANSLASYTHDHQFSRLEKITAVTDIQDENGNWNRAGNFVIPATYEENAVCYHIVNKDGTLVQHKHEDSGYDEGYDVDGDGKDDLKENRQHYYIPFHQLFTGYGWGATMSENYDGVTAGSTVTSVKKFAANDVTTLKSDTDIKIGELFEGVVSTDMISQSTLQVFVSPADENSTVTGTYTANTVDWTQGILKLTGTGAAKITITDYIYCEPTVLMVEVRDYYYTITYIHNGEPLIDPVKIKDNTVAVSTKNEKAAAKAAEAEGNKYAFNYWMNVGSTQIDEIEAGNTKDIVLYPSFQSLYTAIFVDQDGNILDWCTFTQTDFDNVKDKAEAITADKLPVIEDCDFSGKWEVHVANGEGEAEKRESLESYDFSKNTTDITIYPIYTYNGSVELNPIDTDGDGDVDAYEVVGYSGGQGQDLVEIPARVNGLEIVRISEKAFSSYAALHAVVIPTTVKTMGTSSFANDWNWTGDGEDITIYYEGNYAQWQELVNSIEGEWYKGMGGGTRIFFLNGTGKVDPSQGYVQYEFKRFLGVVTSRTWSYKTTVTTNLKDEYDNTCVCEDCNGNDRPDRKYWTDVVV